MRRKFSLWTAAKINLYLNVIGKRSDGYHEIESIMQSVTLYDKITLTPVKEGIEILSDEPDIPLSKENLCYKAAEIFLKKTKIKKGLRIEIYKNIPRKAGLGGGSADAAATLWGINKLFRIGVPPVTLSKWASLLGSDVPFCLKGGTSLARGKGEKLIPLPSLKNGWILLLDPEIPISTSWVYKKIKGKLTKKKLNAKLLAMVAEKEGLLGISNFLYNRLEKVVLEKFPVIKAVKEEMRRAGAEETLMTGSGSTIFGIVDKREKGESILKKLQKRGRVYLVQPTDKNLKEG